MIMQNLTANSTTCLKKGQGKLGTININTIGATGNTLKIYDGLDNTGTLMGTIDTTIAAAPTRIYNAVFQKGLTIVLAAGTAADVTVAFE